MAPPRLKGLSTSSRCLSLNGHKLEQTLGDSGGRGSLVCCIHGVTKILPGRTSTHVFYFLWVPSQGHRSWPNHFLPLLPNCLCIFLIALVVQVSFCQFPVGFQREFFHMYMYFWCVHGWRWDPLSFTLPTWAKPSTCVFWWMDKENVIDIMKY